MKTRMPTLFGLALAGALLSAGSVAAPPAKKTAPTVSTAAPVSASAQPPARKRKVAGYPFRGKLAAVDPAKKTITVTTKNTRRVFPVNAKTKFIKKGRPAKLADGVVGEPVAGYVRKLPDGKLLAATVHFSPPPKAKTPRKPAPKSTSPAPK